MKKLIFILIFVILSTLSYAQYSTFGNNTVELNLDKQSLINKKNNFIEYLRQSYGEFNIPFANKSFNPPNYVIQIIILFISLIPFLNPLNIKFKLILFIMIEVILNVFVKFMKPLI